jgi:hypothetical protein
VSVLEHPPRLSPVLISLLKGVVYQDQQQKIWQDLVNLQGPVSDYVAVLGLDLFIDEAEGFAYLKQQEGVEESDGEEMPRLVARRALSYPVSLLCILLRKKLLEADAEGETRVILERKQIVDTLAVFLPTRANEARIVEQVDAHVNRLVEFGFLRRLRGETELFEVRRILKAFVDADWVADFKEKLESYKEHADRIS